MSTPRRALRLALLTILGLSLTACHFHRCGGGYRVKVPVRICR